MNYNFNDNLNLMMNNNFNDNLNLVKNYIDNILNDKTFSSVLTIFLVLYGNLAAPVLSKNMADLFNTFNMKMLILFFICYYSTKEPKISILMAICFFISIQTATNYSCNDNIKKFITKNNDNKHNKNNIEQLKLENIDNLENIDHNDIYKNINIDNLMALENKNENNMIYQSVEGFDVNSYYNI